MRTADRLSNIFLRQAREAETDEEARVFSDLACHTFTPNSAQVRAITHIKAQKSLCEARDGQMVVLDPRGNFAFPGSAAKALALVEKEEGCYLDFVGAAGCLVYSLCTRRL